MSTRYFAARSVAQALTGGFRKTYVHAGTIMRCVGNPNTAPQWQWRCGFSPGSGPGECKNGTAASYEAVRSGFLAAWRVFLSHRTDEHCDHAGRD